MAGLQHLPSLLTFTSAHTQSCIRSHTCNSLRLSHHDDRLTLCLSIGSCSQKNKRASCYCFCKLIWLNNVPVWMGLKISIVWFQQCEWRVFQYCLFEVLPISNWPLMWAGMDWHALCACLLAVNECYILIAFRSYTLAVLAVCVCVCVCVCGVCVCV